LNKFNLIINFPGEGFKEIYESEFGFDDCQMSTKTVPSSSTKREKMLFLNSVI